MTIATSESWDLPRHSRRLDVCAEARLWLVDVAALPGFDTSRLPLSAEERARAARFYRAEDRARFMLARTALRRLLADATGAAPEALIFSEGPFGKPTLAGRRDAPFQDVRFQDVRLQDIHFNVSHSGAFALIGLSTRPIGVDIEIMRENLDELSLAETFFCAGEHRFLESLDGEARFRAFYRMWTCKEAVLKAFGVGIAEYLKHFCVDWSKGSLAIEPQPGCFTPALSGVHVETVEAPEGYAAALALA